MSNPSELLYAIFEMRRSSSSLSLELFHLTHCSRSFTLYLSVCLSLSLSLSSSVYCLFLFGRAAPCVVVKASFRLFLAWPFIALISAHFIKRSSSPSLSLCLFLCLSPSLALGSARLGSNAQVPCSQVQLPLNGLYKHRRTDIKRRMHQQAARRLQIQIQRY